MNFKNPLHKFYFFLGMVGIFAIVIFTLQNSEIVIIRFLIWKLEMSRVILILVVLFIGMLLGYVFHGLQHNTRKK